MLKLKKPAIINILSASGSKNCPHFVTYPNRLAEYPSYQSVREAIQNMKINAILENELVEKSRNTKIGVKTILNSVKRLGKVNMCLTDPQG